MKILITLAIASSAALAFGQAKPLAGTVGVIGTPARIGSYQFILTGASFAARFVKQDGIEIAPKGKKLLVLNYTVQNPGKVELPYDWGSITFTVVGADNSNYNNKNFALNPEKMTSLNLAIKPAQKIAGVTVVEVPASDPIPKLMVRAGESAVLRYDLRGKTKRYVGPFAAADGVTVNDTASFKLGEKIELGSFDFVVEKVEDVTSALGEYTPDEGEKYIVVTVAFTNINRVDENLNWGTYAVTMEDENAEPIQFRTVMLRGVGNTGLNADQKPGQTVRGRYLFSAPAEIKPAKLSMQLGEDRSVTIVLK